MNNLVALFTTMDGRIGRARFWLGVLLIAAFSIAISVILMLAGLSQTTIATGTVQVNGGAASEFSQIESTLNPWAAFLLSVVTAFPSAAIGVKRRRDRDFSGVDVLGFLVLSLLLQLLGAFGIAGWLITALQFVLLIWAICLLIVLGVLRGTTGPNRYGPDPLGPTTAPAPAPQI
ncbi:MAG: hypothetical protein JWQ89_3158 [Devosia sp.]|uniref:DUF805 domain-containing protein n=1 Tax=Devosia sp. TaxID=1871048 RepID=UPI002633696F|nr:DUF805 domain-containing protein [Devosia sp.]MDB5541431.1 hypothetical protein [Devosia sp.]